ncbi:hypothetical protein IWQ60_000937 [Tieghemiomyces parasiticus]|uniref:Uncharacterized protein n=1 Tax=Tieghemiomyces parasiticus TaxID=78921 RepID=A0A9W8E2D5_9FUNG|nr:hypothetical protein IWQ60_000937 [Tieghemiomyces parasiticus]
MVGTFRVFTVNSLVRFGHRFTGIPVAVCLLPADLCLDGEVLSNIASDMGAAVTAFVQPLFRPGQEVVLDGTSEYTRNDVFALFWFTPLVELSLCAHATLAAGHVILKELKSVHQTIEFKTLSDRISVVRDSWGQDTRIALLLPADPQPCSLADYSDVKGGASTSQRHARRASTASTAVATTPTLDKKVTEAEAVAGLTRNRTIKAARAAFESRWRGTGKSDRGASALSHHPSHGADGLRSMAPEQLENLEGLTETILGSMLNPPLVRAVVYGPLHRNLLIHIAGGPTELRHFAPVFTPEILVLGTQNKVSSLVVTCSPPAGTNYDFAARCFSPWTNVEEEAMTGGSYSALAAYWSARCGLKELRGLLGNHRKGLVNLMVSRSRGEYVQMSGSSQTIITGKYDL